MRAERLEQLMRLRDPPAVPRPEYQWPTKLFVRPKSQDVEVRMVQLQERTEVVEVLLAARRGVTPKPEASVLQMKGPTDVPVTTSAEETGAVDTRDVGIQVDFPSSSLQINIAVPLINPPSLESKMRSRNRLRLGLLWEVQRIQSDSGTQRT
ncbi:hypothetical protein PHMEG_00020643 [Phytophthora megakarya]|uniref:Uncharacterized protein n=1 Tax=Phytophthora megakarya TaxID=4795 RepID=A0A225VNU5_9STRA|nr:hypothetical protein PHMEG_00020643 [Phytophthora megakarya]